MAKVKIQAGAEIDMLTKGELDDSNKHQHDAFFRELAHGKKYLRLGAVIGTPAAGALTMPAGSGPNQGFVWAIQRLTVGGLAANDQLGVYRNTTDVWNLLGVMGAGTASTFHVGGKGLILLGGESLIFSGTGLAAAAAVTVNGELIEAPATEIWKIL